MKPDIVAAIEQQEALATESGDLSEERSEAIDHYLGRPYGDEQDGRSQVVMRDVADTIEWIKPSLMRIFASGDEVVSFTPTGPEDVGQAEQETAYCNYVLNQKNNGFLILHDWFHDALLQKTGYVFVQHETEQRKSRESYRGLSDDELAMLMEGKPEVLAYSVRPGPLGDVHDVTIQATEEYGCTKVTNIEPERVLISPDWPDLDLQGCPFTEVIHYCTVSDLRQMGYEVDDNISDNANNDDPFERRRTDLEWNKPDEESLGADPATRRVKVRYVWMRFDEDQDGIAELRRVVIVGTTILENEETDIVPIAAITPTRVPHEHYGLSIDDAVSDLQRIRTALARGFLDNMYLANNGRYAIDASMVNLDDMLTARPGGVVRVNGQPGTAIAPLLHPQESGAILQAIEYIDTVRENRTGVTRYNQGLDAQSLNKTAHGMSQIMTASQQRIELIARIFAETGVKNLMLLIHGISLQNGRKPEVIRLRNDWITVDPRSWKTRRDLTVSVGLGAGNKDQQSAMLMQILMMQQQAAAVGIATPQNIYHALTKFTQNAGFKDVEAFWTDPSKAPPQQPPPNPDMVKAEIQAQEMQMNAQAEQQRQQLEAQKLQVDAVQEARKQDQDAEQAERDRHVEIYKAELQRQTDLEIARMREEFSMQTQMRGEAMQQQKDTEAAESKNYVGELRALIGELVQGVQQLAEAMNAPREVVRDESGRAVGVSVGGRVRPIVRGPDGKVSGLQ